MLPYVEINLEISSQNKQKGIARKASKEIPNEISKSNEIAKKETYSEFNRFLHECNSIHTVLEESSQTGIFTSSDFINQSIDSFPFWLAENLIPALKQLAKHGFYGNFFKLVEAYIYKNEISFAEHKNEKKDNKFKKDHQDDKSIRPYYNYSYSIQNHILQNYSRPDLSIQNCANLTQLIIFEDSKDPNFITLCGELLIFAALMYFRQESPTQASLTQATPTQDSSKDAGNENLLFFLLNKKKISPNFQLKHFKCTPLQLAYFNGNKSGIKLLIEHGASIDVCTKAGNNMLTIALLGRCFGCGGYEIDENMELLINNVNPLLICESTLKLSPLTIACHTRFAYTPLPYRLTLIGNGLIKSRLRNAQRVAKNAIDSLNISDSLVDSDSENFEEPKNFNRTLPAARIQPENYYEKLPAVMQKDLTLKWLYHNKQKNNSMQLIPSHRNHYSFTFRQDFGDINITKEMNEAAIVLGISTSTNPPGNRQIHEWILTLEALERTLDSATQHSAIARKELQRVCQNVNTGTEALLAPGVKSLFEEYAYDLNGDRAEKIKKTLLELRIPQVLWNIVLEYYYDHQFLQDINSRKPKLVA